MSIIDDLVENLVERHAIRLSGTFTITLVSGGAAMKGHLVSTLKDQRKGKDLLKLSQDEMRIVHPAAPTKV